MPLGEVEILYLAMAEDVGLIVSEPFNIAQLKQRLYAEMRDKPEFKEALSILTSPTAPDTELWIVKKAIPNE